MAWVARIASLANWDFFGWKISHQQIQPFFSPGKNRSVLASMCLFRCLVGGKPLSSLKRFSMLKSLNHLILLRIQQMKPHLEGELHCHFPVKKKYISTTFRFTWQLLFFFLTRSKKSGEATQLCSCVVFSPPCNGVTLLNQPPIPIRGANAIVHRVELEAVEKEPQLVHRSLRGLRRLGPVLYRGFLGKANDIHADTNSIKFNMLHIQSGCPSFCSGAASRNVGMCGQLLHYMNYVGH